MESHIQSQEDHLIEGLSFKFKPGASYVTQRDSVSYFPSGGNQYTPAGVKVVKIALSGDNWLDPSTVKIMFTLNNRDGTDVLEPLTGPWGFFRRYRLIAGGQTVIDIDNYNRTYEMFHMMLPAEKRINDSIEGFEISATTTSINFSDHEVKQPIAANNKNSYVYTSMWNSESGQIFTITLSPNHAGI